MMARGTACLAALFLAIVSFAATANQFDWQQFEGRTVTEVRYDPVEQPIDPRDLATSQMVSVGRAFDLTDVGSTIDRLFATGLYQDIKVYAELKDGGVTVRFQTVAQQFVGHVEVRGKIKDPPSRATLIGATQLDLGKPYNASEVQQARKRLDDEFKGNGLFKSTLGVTTIRDPRTEQITVGFIVNAGKRARYEMPTIEGDTKLSVSSLLAATGWRIRIIHRWRQVTKSLTDSGISGIEKKYAKQDRLMARVELQSVDSDENGKRARPHLSIEAGPKTSIRAVEAKVSKKVLQKTIPVYQEGTVDNDLLTEGARNLRDYFQGRGYPEVDVTFKREPVKDDREVISYYISTGPLRNLMAVNVEGNRYFTDTMIRERIFLAKKSLLLRHGRYSDIFRTKDEEAIRDLYQSNGFRDAKVTSTVEENYQGKESDIEVTYHINEGRQWTISKLEIDGDQQLDLAPVRGDLASVAGQPFSEVSVATDRNRILEYYSSNGFLSAGFHYREIPDPETATMHLAYQIREGQKKFVRQVLLSGLDITRSSTVAETVGEIQPGEPISQAKITDVSRRLDDLGVFASVDSALQNPDGRDTYKYVLFDFDEANRYTFNTGFGLEFGQYGRTTNNLSQAEGAKSISPIITFDVNRNNFLGRAQTLSLQIRYSTLEQRESLNYIVPRFLHSANRTLTFSTLYDTTQDVQTFSSRRAEASVQLSQRFNRASTLLTRFEYRRVSVGNLYIPSLLVPQLLQPVRIGSLAFSYIQDHRDNPSDAKRGFYNTVDAALAGSMFGSQRNFVRVLARNATYTSLWHKLVLARQTQIGAIVPFNVSPGVSSFDAIPLPERFFGGGSVSMRGFADNQAGPRDIGTVSELGAPGSNPTGFPIGGNALFFNSVELRFPLLGPNISGVVFHDMGNIYSSYKDVSLAYKQSSISTFNYAVQAPGIGIRYKTPLGPLRVDFSYALNPPQYLGYSTDLTIQDLLNGCGGVCPVSTQRLSHFNFFFSIGQAF
jgi:outer membrane protein assembly complex protein YaeT